MIRQAKRRHPHRGRGPRSQSDFSCWDLRGDVAGHPQFEPAAKLEVKLGEAVAVGAEAYGAFGPIDDLGSEHGSRLFGVVDLTGDWWDLNLGAGYGWGDADHVVAKVIVGIHPRA